MIFSLVKIVLFLSFTFTFTFTFKFLNFKILNKLLDKVFNDLKQHTHILFFLSITYFIFLLLLPLSIAFMLFIFLNFLIVVYNWVLNLNFLEYTFCVELMGMVLKPAYLKSADTVKRLVESHKKHNPTLTGSPEMEMKLIADVNTHYHKLSRSLEEMRLKAENGKVLGLEPNVNLFSLMNLKKESRLDDNVLKTTFRMSGTDKDDEALLSTKMIIADAMNRYSLINFPISENYQKISSVSGESVAECATNQCVEIQRVADSKGGIDNCSVRDFPMWENLYTKFLGSFKNTDVDFLSILIVVSSLNISMELLITYSSQFFMLMSMGLPDTIQSMYVLNSPTKMTEALTILYYDLKPLSLVDNCYYISIEIKDFVLKNLYSYLQSDSFKRSLLSYGFNAGMSLVGLSGLGKLITFTANFGLSSEGIITKIDIPVNPTLTDLKVHPYIIIPNTAFKLYIKNTVETTADAVGSSSYYLTKTILNIFGGMSCAQDEANPKAVLKLKDFVNGGVYGLSSKQIQDILSRRS